MVTNIYKSSDYKKIVKDLLDGKVVGFPTETVYGLAIVYNNKEAFDKLYEIKQRSITKPISMMVSKNTPLEKVAYVDSRACKVIDKFMPGSITIILKAKEDLPEHVTFNYPTVGIRIPTNETALKILEEVGVPLLVTSANISSEPSLVKASDVYEKFNGKISSLIDEDSGTGLASTVVSLVDKPAKVLRAGPISQQQIAKVLGE